MKKRLGFLLIIILFAYNLSLSIVSAQEVSPSAMPTPAPIEYQLPYPGILPGHPFYFLKDIRDGILGFLISSPLKKAEYDLLQVDKNFAAVELLFNQKRGNALIFKALSRAETYFEDAIKKSVEAKKQGVDISDFVTKITIANLKHQEMVLNFSKVAKGEDKKMFEVELNNLEDLGKKAKTLSYQ